MNREQRLREIQKTYRSWSDKAEFISDTQAIPEDEDKFYESLIEQKLIPVEKTEQQLLFYPLSLVHGGYFI